MSGIIIKLVQCRNRNCKDFFFKFRFIFEELSRFEVLCEHGISGMIIFNFSVIYVQFKIFSIKNKSKLHLTLQNESI